jgi:hypothetical protein
MVWLGIKAGLYRAGQYGGVPWRPPLPPAAFVSSLPPLVLAPLEPVAPLEPLEPEEPLEPVAPLEPEEPLEPVEPPLADVPGEVLVLLAPSLLCRLQAARESASRAPIIRLRVIFIFVSSD